jgi:tRNA-specific adenosine deaminase 3
MDSGVTVLLSPLELYPLPPVVPPEMGGFRVYQLGVPAYPAVTTTSMKIKQQIWPVMYAPPRKHEPEAWSAGEVRWATTVMKQIAKYALSNRTEGEVYSEFFQIVGC